MMRSQEPYTPDEDEAIREGVGRRLSAREIGTLLGRTRNSIIGRAHRIGSPWELSRSERSRYNTWNARRKRK